MPKVEELVFVVQSPAAAAAKLLQLTLMVAGTLTESSKGLTWLDIHDGSPCVAFWQESQLG